MLRIFLSYRREDSIATAGRLHDRFCREFGSKNVFIDVDNIPAGTDFTKHLREQVATCDVLLAIIGPKWLDAKDGSGRSRLHQEDDFVLVEIAAALRRDVRVIPILVDGALMPKAGDLPDAIKSLAQRNAVEIHNTQFNLDTGRLLEQIRSTPSGKRGSFRLAQAGAAALCCIGLLSFYHFGLTARLSQSEPPGPAGFDRSDFVQLDRTHPPDCEPSISAVPEPVPIVYQGLANLALLKQTRSTASSVLYGFNRRHQVRFLNDGWYNNCRSWIPNAMPAWVELDLGDVFNVNMIRIGSEHTPFWSDRALKGFSIQLRRDSESEWMTVYAHDGAQGAIKETTPISFEGRTAEFVRVTITATAENDLPRIDELEVYGTRVATQPTVSR